MSRMLALAIAVVLSLGTLLSAAPNALAEEKNCTGRIGARTVDNLRGPSGGSCVLEGTRVKRTIKVERTATLKASKISVVGNAQAEGHKSVTLGGNSTVGGSVRFDQGGVFRVITTEVDGRIGVRTNQAESRLKSNDVDQGIPVFGHRGGIGISDNRVDGTLQCKDNSRAPTGGGNGAPGNKEDQCKRL